jgi:hypothetical protein
VPQGTIAGDLAARLELDVLVEAREVDGAAVGGERSDDGGVRRRERRGACEDLEELRASIVSKRPLCFAALSISPAMRGGGRS